MARPVRDTGGAAEHPADEFVASFVGADRALKRLGLATLAEIELVAVDGEAAPELTLPLGTSVRDALSAILAAGGRPFAVVDETGGGAWRRWTPSDTSTALRSGADAVRRRAPRAAGGRAMTLPFARRR